MFCHKLRSVLRMCHLRKLQQHNCRHIYILNTPNLKKEDDKSTKQQLTIFRGFDDAENKNRDTYLDLIRIYINREHQHRRAHVEFIYAALRNMEAFNVHKDLEVYKQLLDVFPKGKMVAKNMIQVEFMHYPKQQQCAIDLLEQMEDNGVMPDYEMEDQLTNTFGRKSFPLRKFWRMMYWMPKFKNLSPWPLPDPLPDDQLELARLAIARITSADDQTTVSLYESRNVPEALDTTWIVSGQSPIQRRLLREHDVEKPLYVEGPHVVWLRKTRIDYFVLRSEPIGSGNEEERDADDVTDLRIPFWTTGTATPLGRFLPKRQTTVHEQEDGVIIGVCATGTSSRDSLLSWVRLLEKDGNAKLSEVPVVFRLAGGGRKELATVEDNDKDNQLEKS